MTQKDLFDEKRDVVNRTVVLYAPDETRYDDYKNLLHCNYTKPPLQAITEHLVRLLRGCRITIEDTSLKQAIETIRRKPTNVSKSSLVDFIALFIADGRNLQFYLDSLSPDERKILEIIVRKGTISQSEIKRRTGKEWLAIDRGRYGYGMEITATNDCAHWFLNSRDETHYRNPNCELYVVCQSFLRQLLIPFFLREDEYNVTLLPELPTDGELPLSRFDASQSIFRELAVMDGFWKQKMLDVNDKGKLPASAIKKVAERMKLPEFFPGHLCKMAATIRANQLLSYVALRWHLAPCDISRPEVAIKDMFASILHYPTVLVPILLPHISGLRSSDIKDSNAMRILQAFFSETFVQQGTDWLSVDQLLMRWKQKGGYQKLFSPYLLSRLNLSNKLFEEVIKLDEMEAELHDAYYRSFLFMLATLGILEVAYEPLLDDSPSLFSSLRYIRFTQLGLYCIDRNKTYKAPEAMKDEVRFELDERNLIIRTIGEDNPYEPLLFDMAEPIGHHRFKVTPASLLKNCTTHKELLQRKDFFKRFICRELPEIWENFFNTLSKRYNPLTEQSIDTYALYRIDANNKELLHILSTDVVIRKHSLRVEGYLLLIEKENLKEVLTQLKSYGYLL